MNKHQIVAGINERITELKNMKQVLEKNTENKETVILGWRKIHGKIRYIRKENCMDKTGTYLGTKDSEEISVLAEKYRNSKYLYAIEKETDRLEKCLKILNKPEYGSEVDKVWDVLPQEVKDYTVPAPFTDEEYAKKWQKQIHRRNKVVGQTPYKTLRGDYVRSKSEMIIADKLYLAGIPYHYEINRENKDIYGDYYNVQPDFTVLNKRTRQVYVWEHLGKLGDNDYCSISLPKINDYIRDGLIPGKNLILSFESQNCPLEVQVVETLIRDFLL